MREQDKAKRRPRYAYALLRFRLPGGVMLQGVFGAHETLAAARAFVAECLADGPGDGAAAAAARLTLTPPGAPPLTAEADLAATLAEAQLTPMAVINVAAGGSLALRADLMAAAAPL